MNNFHIGLPGNFLNTLETLFRVEQLVDPGASRLIPRSVWQGHYRDFISGRSSAMQDQLRPDEADFVPVDDLLEDGPIGITIPDLMGRPDHCFTKARPLPYADERIHRLAQVFDGHPLTLHLTITSQYDYLNAESSRGHWEKLGIEIRSVPSWSDLTKRIRMASKGVQLRVWDFEQPRKVALPFVMDMLNVSDENAIYQLERGLSRMFPKETVINNNSEVNVIGSDLVEAFDEQYEKDLAEIASMSDVTLMGPENFTRDYFLFD